MAPKETDIPVFRTPEGKARYLAAYDAALARCPVPLEDVYVPTAFGTTHVIASGDLAAPPLILLHCAMGSASVWHPNLADFTKHFRVLAVDVICEPNKSVASRRITEREEFARWLGEVMDGLHLSRARVVGNSFGGFLAANMAVYEPGRVEAMVLISPAATFVPVWRFFMRALLLFLRRPETRGPIMLKRMEIDPESPWAETFRLAASEGRIIHRVAPAVIPAEELRRITQPLLLLIGDRDSLYRPKTPQQVIERARQSIPGLEAEIIANCNHVAAMALPEYVDARIIRFFHERSGATS